MLTHSIEDMFKLVLLRHAIVIFPSLFLALFGMIIMALCDTDSYRFQMAFLGLFCCSLGRFFIHFYIFTSLICDWLTCVYHEQVSLVNLRLVISDYDDIVLVDTSIKPISYMYLIWAVIEFIIYKNCIIGSIITISIPIVYIFCNSNLVKN